MEKNGEVGRKAEGPQITVSQSFSAVISKAAGRETGLKVKSREFYQHQLSKFREGEEVSVVITNKRPKRTEQQNRYYWGVYLPLIARETGEQNTEALHELFKALFLTVGVVEVRGRKVRIKKSTADLGVGEFCEYIAAIHNETGVEPPPTENFGLEPIEEGLKKHDNENKRKK